MYGKNTKFAASVFEDFEHIKELYSSTVGAVYLGVFKYDKHRYVLKERKYAEIGKRKDVMHEVALLNQFDHPNIIRCEGWFANERRKSIFIVLEYCEGYFGAIFSAITVVS